MSHQKKLSVCRQVNAAGRRYLAAGLLSALLLAGCDDGEGGLVVAGEYPVAYVERPLPVDDLGAAEPDDLRDPGRFNPGARLLLKQRAAPAVPALDIAGRLFAAGERYDVRDVVASVDGARLLFALRGPYLEDADEDDQPKWNLWEYDIANDSLRRLIVADIVADEGHDIMPAYLPDGRVAFASTRQRATRAILVDEGKPQFAPLDDALQNEVYTLHTMAADGTDIRQVTFNSSHDLYPTVLDDGTLLFSRQVRSDNRVAMHLFRVRPDGSGLAPVFGRNSHDTVEDVPVEFARPRQLDDGRVLVLQRPYQTRFLGGALAALDIRLFSDRDQPLDGSTGSGGVERYDLDGYPGEAIPSRRGRYADAVPLGDGSGRLLVSWSTCRVQAAQDPLAPPPAVPPRIFPCEGRDVADPQWSEAAPVYGVFVQAPGGGRRLPVVVPRAGYYYDSLAVAVPRALPVYLPPVVVDPDWVEAGVGVLDIRSVYDFDGSFGALGGLLAGIDALADPLQAGAGQRPARWLRIEKAASIPDDDVRDFRRTAFGISAANGMREILGYALVEPDGSVRTRVPANVPFTLSVVDAQGRRIGGRHGAWLQVVPGEERRCAGCHLPATRLPHGRNDSGIPSLHPGAVGGLPYPNTDPARVAEAGETMAQLRARLDGDVPPLSVDLRYTDDWTDPLLRAPDAPEALLYADLATPAPASDACQAAWTALCRTVIHYEAHIHPLWARDRRVFDVDEVTLLDDHTCTACHSSRNALDEVQLPAAQLDLRDGYSGEVADHLAAYRELLVADAEQELVDGALVDRLVQATDAGGNLLYVTDENGVPLEDEFGQPIPLMVPVTLPAPLSLAGARASTRFFPRFLPGGSHAGWLSPAELRLLAEWVDGGAQYYNDPFAAPVD